MLRISQRDLDRYASKFSMQGSDDCWQWEGECNKSGRARIWFAGAKRCASHIALQLAGKPRPEGLVAMHSCDNPGCVNPRHLSWGTQADNIVDREAKGRGGAAFGERSSAAKLTVRNVRAIREDPRTLTEIAKSYGVRITTITNIKTGRTWRNV